MNLSIALEANLSYFIWYYYPITFRLDVIQLNFFIKNIFTKSIYRVIRCMLLKIKCFWKLIFLRTDYSILPLNHSRTTNKKRLNKFYLTRILSHPNFTQTFYPIVEIFVTSSSHNRSLILSIWLNVSLLSEDKGSFGIGLCIFQLGLSIVKVPLMLVHLWSSTILRVWPACHSCEFFFLKMPLSEMNFPICHLFCPLVGVF